MNYINKYPNRTAYNSDSTKQYPNVSYIEGEDKLVFANPIYRWEWDSDYHECDDCTLYGTKVKQVSYDNGQTWSNVVPEEREINYEDFIEDDSEECGCGGDCSEGANWNWRDATEYYDSMAVMEFYMDAAASDEWNDGDTFEFSVCSQCNNDGCPSAKFVIEIRDDTDYEEDPSAAPFLQPYVSIYDGCDCVDGECSHFVAEVLLGDNEGDTLNIYNYVQGEEGVDSLHIYDNLSGAPSGLMFNTANECIDQGCEDE